MCFQLDNKKNRRKAIFFCFLFYFLAKYVLNLYPNVIVIDWLIGFCTQSSIPLSPSL